MTPEPMRQLLRRVGDGQRAVVREDVLLVERRAGQRAGGGAGGHDHVLRRDGFRAGHELVALAARLHERAAAVEERHLVLLEEEQDAVVVLLHHLVLAGQHLRDVDREPRHVDAVVGEVLRGVLVVLGRLQQRLRRDAAHVGAGAARGRLAALGPLVDARGVEAQLRRADGGDVAAGAAADDDHVK
jgi:hypothetical protein